MAVRVAAHLKQFPHACLQVYGLYSEEVQRVKAAHPVTVRSRPVLSRAKCAVDAVQPACRCRALAALRQPRLSLAWLPCRRWPWTLGMPPARRGRSFMALVRARLSSAPRSGSVHVCVCGISLAVQLEWQAILLAVAQPCQPGTLQNTCCVLRAAPQGWLGAKETILYGGKGPVHCARMSGTLLAWATSTGIR